MSRILVTGGAGFIGSNLVDALIEQGHEVSILDNFSSGKWENINPKAAVVQADICNLEAITPVFKDIEYVFHTAAMARIQPSIIDPIETIKNNILGTTNVLLAARDAKVKKVIYSASSSYYGDQDKSPLTEDMVGVTKNPYSLAKHVGEELCRIFRELYGLDTVSLRYFNVYGKRQLDEGAYCTVIGIFLRQVKNREPITIVGDGEIRRDMTNVDDVVRANILAMEKETYGKVINIGTGTNYSINEAADFILRRTLDLGLEDALKWGHAVYIPARPGESRETLADITKAREILGWEPLVSFKEGIKALI